MAYWKKIKNTNAVPVLKDELVFDQTPTVNSTNPVTSDGVARAIAGASGEVPVVTESDNGKVLKAIYDAGGPAVEWGEATVDQTYDATSTNAQSGVAVAQAIAAIPSASYTAGDGIDIDAQNEVSVNVGTGLSINSGSTGNLTLAAPLDTSDSTYKCLGRLTAQAVAAIKNNAALKVTVLAEYQIDSSSFWSNDVRVAVINQSPFYPVAPNIGLNVAILSSTNIYSEFVYNSGTSKYVMSANTQVTVDFANATIGSNTSWDAVEANPTNYMLVLAQVDSSIMYRCAYSAASGSDPETKDVASIEYTVPGDNSLEVSNPLPSYAAADAGKVLQVNADGTGTQWTNYVPAEVVQALPASPTSGVLYIVTGE
mgnify:CR=1 FL=1